jgi:ribosomal protein S18 acetylase RimI-like enzyme
VRAKLRDPKALLLVAEDDGRPVGMLLAELARADDGAGAVVPGLLHLSMLFVHPAAQRRGVGTALLRALTDRYPRVQVWTGADNDAALALFAAAGFRPSGRTQELAVGAVVHLER